MMQEEQCQPGQSRLLIFAPSRDPETLHKPALVKDAAQYPYTHSAMIHPAMNLSRGYRHRCRTFPD